MAVTFAPFDAANYLKDEKDIAAYLAIVSEDGDPAEIIAALNTVARKRNMSQPARAMPTSS